MLYWRTFNLSPLWKRLLICAVYAQYWHCVAVGVSNSSSIIWMFTKPQSSIVTFSILGLISPVFVFTKFSNRSANKEFGCVVASQYGTVRFTYWVIFRCLVDWCPLLGSWWGLANTKTVGIQPVAWPEAPINQFRCSLVKSGQGLACGFKATVVLDTVGQMITGPPGVVASFAIAALAQSCPEAGIYPLVCAYSCSQTMMDYGGGHCQCF